MKPALHTLSFPGAMVQRGFWLYVWRVQLPASEVLYVGRTGDNSSPHATAPYTRMGQHLGSIKTQNALRKHLAARGFEPQDCETFELISYGPIFPEVEAGERSRDERMLEHLPFRNIVGALERDLAGALSEAGYDVVNSVKWRHGSDPQLWQDVRAAFAAHFPGLADASGEKS